MKLETKYGVLEGTVEEFRELLKGKVSRSWSFPSKGYKVVNKDIGGTLTKGTVLKHIIAKTYEDTSGNQYILHDNELDDCNDNHIEESFKNSKRRGTLLKHKGDKYKVAKEDFYVNIEGNIMIEKDTVLVDKGAGFYKDSLGNEYLLHPDIIENKLKEFYMVGTVFHFEEHKRNNELYKLTLPNNQF